jgi:hypothetical protein
VLSARASDTSECLESLLVEETVDTFKHDTSAPTTFSASAPQMTGSSYSRRDFAARPNMCWVLSPRPAASAFHSCGVCEGSTACSNVSLRFAWVGGLLLPSSAQLTSARHLEAVVWYSKK